MPLPDDPFERGKCGYKLIQYMACGKSVIASPVGANATIVENGRTGYLARDNKEWTAALAALCDNPDLREQMGSAGRKKVEAIYSLQTNSPRLAALLRGAAGAS
jgi:glycosyltransferase involved in cell wall biosynthesis